MKTKYTLVNEILSKTNSMSIICNKTRMATSIEINSQKYV